MKMLDHIAIQSGVAIKSIERVIELFENGSTIPN
jgi:hypothetical protein